MRISGSTDRLTILGIWMKSMVWWCCSSSRWPTSEIIKGRWWSSRSCRISSSSPALTTNGRKLFGVGWPSMPLHNQLAVTKNYEWIWINIGIIKLTNIENSQMNDPTIAIAARIITNDRKVATITFDIIFSKTFRKRRENTAPRYIEYDKHTSYSPTLTRRNVLFFPRVLIWLGYTVVKLVFCQQQKGIQYMHVFYFFFFSACNMLYICV